MRCSIKLQDRIFGFPVYMLGVLVDRLRRMNNPSKLFFFFTDYHTGGAEQVHVDILKLFAKERPWVMIVFKSKNSFHKAAMEQCAELFEVGKYITNRNRFFVKNFFFGYYTSLLNRHKGAVVLSSMNNFIADISPQLRHVYRMDLIHCFLGIKPKDMIRPATFLGKRVLVSRYLQEELFTLYREWGVEAKYQQRTKVIYNAVPVPESLPEKDYSGTLRVVFIGRNSPEKRYHLYQQVAESCKKQAMKLEFVSIGNFSSTNEISCLGEMTEKEAIYQVLHSAHLLVLCSTTEGFGLVVAEAMACGVVPIATAVGGVPELISDGVTGNLVHATDEPTIVEECVRLLSQYYYNPQSLQAMSRAGYAKVKQEFNQDVFRNSYLQLIAEARERQAT